MTEDPTSTGENPQNPESTSLFSATASLLEKRMGLAVDTVGTDLIARIVHRHMKESGLSDEKEYLAQLRKPGRMWESLVEAVVVPETWFFRNRESFDYLGRFARLEWLIGRKQEAARILCVPCATGEEPYSIAMTLMDAGIPSDKFHIDAMDISNPLLERARAGIYGPGSFRGKDLAFRENYFEPDANGFRLQRSVMRNVRFLKGNILDAIALRGAGPYDAVFCRNLLIYLTPWARVRVAGNLDRMLGKSGIVFVGHIEHELFNAFGFEKVRQFGVFACRRTGRPQKHHGKAEAGVLKGLVPRARPLLLPTGTPSVAPVPPRATQKIEPNVAQDCGRSPQKSNQDVDESPEQEGVELLFDSASKLADQGLLHEALDLCKDLLHRDTLHVQGHFLRGMICLALNDNKGAAESFNSAVYLDPNHDEALEYLAHVVENDGDGSKAAQLRQRVQRIRARDKGC